MPKHIQRAGFAPPTGRRLGQERRAVTCAELIATIGIAVCTLIAATVVARADVATNVIDNEGTLFTLALALGVAFFAVGGLSLFTFGPRRGR